jgi:formylglycine-generating enzyme required for sulfatase activity
MRSGIASRCVLFAALFAPVLAAGCKGGSEEASPLDRALSVRGTEDRISALMSYLGDNPGEERAKAALDLSRRFLVFLSNEAKGLERYIDIPVQGKDRHGNPVAGWTGDGGDPGWPAEILFLGRTDSGPIPPLEFILVPRGSFLMGGEGWFEPGPRHRVVFDRPLYVAKYPVTQAQWLAVMEENPSYFKDSGPEAPVDSVSWDDAKYFVSEMNSWTELPGAAAEAFEFRLPSESEWEYMCRAGSESLYHSGDEEEDLEKVGWFWRNSNTRTHPVGRLTPNEWGLYDMHGNVWEWCEDAWHDSYEGAPSDGSAWVEGGSHRMRVLRGGAWYVMFRGCSSRFRCPIKRLDRHYSVGVRLVLQMKAGIGPR